MGAVAEYKSSRFAQQDASGVYPFRWNNGIQLSAPARQSGTSTEIAQRGSGFPPPASCMACNGLGTHEPAGGRLGVGAKAPQPWVLVLSAVPPAARSTG